MSIFSQHNTSSPIVKLEVQPYQRQHNGNITWYPVRVNLHTNQSYEVKYNYADFVQFSRSIHQAFKLSKAQLATLKKDNYYSNFLKKNNQKYIDRQSELENFCKKLLLLPTEITSSDIIISFFCERHSREPTATSSTSTLKKVSSLWAATNKQRAEITELARISTVSVPAPLLQQHQSITSTISNHSSNRSSNRSSATSSMLFTSSLNSDMEDMIKLKIVYDWNNIIIIRVPRSISLDHLRSQVIQKFALLNIQLPDNLVLLSHDENARYSSPSSIRGSHISGSDVVTMISEEEHLAYAKQTKWSCFQKVILRCMV